MIFDNSIAADRDILTVIRAYHVDQLFICRVIQTAKDDLAFRVITYYGFALARSLGKSQIQFELGTRLDEIQRCHVVDIAHNLRNQVTADYFISFQLLEQA